MRSRFVRATKPPGLMLTSLLDMFTIILIFLIVSFEAEDYEFKLNPDLKLPESSARSVFKPAVNIAVTPKGILVDRKEVVALVDGKAAEEAYKAGEIPELVKELEARFQAINPPEAAGGEEGAEPVEGPVVDDSNDPNIILIQADRDLDYKTLYLVLRSASIAGFVRYRLAILKK